MVLLYEGIPPSSPLLKSLLCPALRHLTAPKLDGLECLFGSKHREAHSGVFFTPFSGQTFCEVAGVPLEVSTGNITLCFVIVLITTEN